MGNSPSSVKNDSSSQAQSQMLQSSSASASQGEGLEPPPSRHKRLETSPLSLSGSPSFDSPRHHRSKHVMIASSASLTTTETVVIPQDKHRHKNKKYSTAYSPKISLAHKLSPPATRGTDFDLDILTSLALAMNINKPTSTRKNPTKEITPTTSANGTANNSSSSSEDVSSSPESEMSLVPDSPSSTISSSFAASSSAPQTSSYPFPTLDQQDLSKKPALSKSKSLDPINEDSLEGTPEPKLSSSSPAKKSKSKSKPARALSASSNSSNDDDDPGLDSIIESLIETGLSRSYSKKLPVTSEQIQWICAKSREIFLSQPMLLELAAPVKVVGDIHGQFYDLLRILKLCGFPPHSNYLFLGDYVDRGKQSLETLLLLLCFKIKYPENFFMLRGNHECASITKMYGFYDECKSRSTTKNWRRFVDVFNSLPVLATIGDKIFCVHGGLSPHLTDIDQIQKLARPTDVPDDGLLSDLLWSDPDPHTISWGENDRGVSYTFGPDVVNKFLKHHNMDLVVRAHMIVEDGYEFFAKKKLVTVFSAPNYCGEFDNWGAVMNVNKNLVCSFEMLKPFVTSKKNTNSNSASISRKKH